MTMYRVGRVWIADTARVVGRVTLGRDANLWYGVVVRGDVAPIEIGAGTNVQDGSVLHCDTDEPLVIGENVSIGHAAVVHCSSVADGALIGIALGLVTYLATGAVYLLARLFRMGARRLVALVLTALGYGAWLALGYDLVYVEPRHTEIARVIITYLGKPMLYSATLVCGLAALGIVATLVAPKRAK